MFYDTEIYYIYEDRIEVKDVLGIRTINRVYFDRVQYVDEETLKGYEDSLNKGG